MPNISWWTDTWYFSWEIDRSELLWNFVDATIEKWDLLLESYERWFSINTSDFLRSYGNVRRLLSTIDENTIPQNIDVKLRDLDLYLSELTQRGIISVSEEEEDLSPEIKLTQQETHDSFSRVPLDKNLSDLVESAIQRWNLYNINVQTKLLDYIFLKKWDISIEETGILSWHFERYGFSLIELLDIARKQGNMSKFYEWIAKSISEENRKRSEERLESIRQQVIDLPTNVEANESKLESSAIKTINELIQTWYEVGSWKELVMIESLEEFNKDSFEYFIKWVARDRKNRFFILSHRIQQIWKKSEYLDALLDFTGFVFESQKVLSAKTLDNEQKQNYINVSSDLVKQLKAIWIDFKNYDFLAEKFNITQEEIKAKLVFS